MWAKCDVSRVILLRLQVALAMTEVYNCIIDPWNIKNIAAVECGFDADQVCSFNHCFPLGQMIVSRFLLKNVN